MTTESGGPLLEVDDLRVEIRTPRGVVRPVDGVSLSVRAGETVAVLGESGSGKTLTARAIVGLTAGTSARIAGGEVRLAGTELAGLPMRERRRTQGSRIAMVFQDALSALNPVLSVGYQIAEVRRVHRRGGRSESRRHAVEMLDLVGIPDAARRARDYPHQFSGGMRQRVMIAMALALDPEVLIADEPTTALDVTVQAQIIDLLASIQRERDMAMLLITHDMGVVADVADRVVVMYGGKVIEQAPAADVYARPAHPYTEALLGSVPTVGSKRRELTVIPGSPPDPSAMPPGCAFTPRCGYASSRCAEHAPPAYQVGDGRTSACHKWKELAG